jgi:hypothetical protein
MPDKNGWSLQCTQDALDIFHIIVEDVPDVGIPIVAARMPS